jgi:hypothetical protein
MTGRARRTEPAHHRTRTNEATTGRAQRTDPAHHRTRTEGAMSGPVVRWSRGPRLRSWSDRGG